MLDDRHVNVRGPMVGTVDHPGGVQPPAPSARLSHGNGTSATERHHPTSQQ